MQVFPCLWVNQKALPEGPNSTEDPIPQRASIKAVPTFQGSCPCLPWTSPWRGKCESNMWREPLRLKVRRGRHDTGVLKFSLQAIEEKKNREKWSPPPPQRSSIWWRLTPGIDLLLDENLKERQAVPTIFSRGCAVRVCTWIVCRCAHRCRCTQLTSVDGETPLGSACPCLPEGGRALPITPLWELGSRFSSLWLIAQQAPYPLEHLSRPRLFLWEHIHHKQAQICANTCVPALALAPRYLLERMQCILGAQARKLNKVYSLRTCSV